MSQPQSNESQVAAARVEVPISGRSRREAVRVDVVPAESDAAGAEGPRDATLAA